MKMIKMFKCLSLSLSLSLQTDGWNSPVALLEQIWFDWTNAEYI